MMPPMNDRVLNDAAEWLTRLQDKSFSSEDMRKFCAWLEISDQHKQALQEMESVWAEIGELEYSQAERLFDRTINRSVWTTISACIRGVFSAGNWRLQPALNSGISAVCIALLTVVVITGTRLQQPQWVVERSQIAEVRELVLPDGSLISLGPDSELRYRIRSDERSLELHRGQAFFDVARDTERAFTVAVGKTNVTVLGTQFDIVRHRRGAKVSVLEGRVQVESPIRVGDGSSNLDGSSASKDESILTGGQALSVDKVDGHGVTEAINSSSVGAWRDGRLSYVNTPLTVVIEDINRYYDTELRLVGDDFSGLNVSATFKVEQLDTALAVLEKSLPIEFDVIDERLILIRRKRDTQ